MQGRYRFFPDSTHVQYERIQLLPLHFPAAGHDSGYRLAGPSQRVSRYRVALINSHSLEGWHIHLQTQATLHGARNPRSPRSARNPDALATSSDRSVPPRCAPPVRTPPAAPPPSAAAPPSAPPITSASCTTCLCPPAWPTRSDAAGPDPLGKVAEIRVLKDLIHRREGERIGAARSLF